MSEEKFITFRLLPNGSGSSWELEEMESNVDLPEYDGSDSQRVRFRVVEEVGV